jgi:hypothetical protein
MKPSLSVLSFKPNDSVFLAERVSNTISSEGSEEGSKE